MTFPVKSVSLLALGALLAGASCGTTRKESSAVVVGVAETPSQSSTATMPHAIIYKTSGNYADNVPVTLNASGTEIVSYPAPTDITPQARPVALDGGFLLDRRGIGPNTAFTRYTYSEYAALKEAPSTEELLKAVIPGAKVTEIVEMPFFNSGSDMQSRCNELIGKGLPGCKVLFSRPVLNLQ